MQTLSKEQYIGKSQNQKGEQKQGLEETQFSGTLNC